MALERFKFGSLEDSAPSNSTSTIHIKHLKCNVEIGTTVSFFVGAENEGNNNHIGRIVDVALSMDDITDAVPPNEFPPSAFPVAKVNLLEKCKESTYRAFHRTPSNNILARHVVEVYQTIEYSWISQANCTGVCFVFHMNTIANGSYPAQGMEKALSIRYSYDGTLVKVIDENNWQPFPCGLDNCTVDESYLARIWKGLILIRDECRKGLNRRAQSQGTFSNCTKTTHVSKDAWNFIVKSLDGVGDLKQATKNRFSYALLPTFKRRKTRVALVCSTLRFQSENDLQKLECVLGECVTFGNLLLRSVP